MKAPNSSVSAGGHVEHADMAWLLGAYDVHRPPPPDRPWLLLDMVASVDGRISLGGKVGALSTPPDKALFRHLRCLADVVLVGAQTVRAESYGPVRCDDSHLARRDARGQAPQPRLCIVSRSLELDSGSRVFDRSGPLPVILTCASSSADRRAELADVAHVEVVGDESVDLAAGLRILRQWGSELIVCEGGATLNSELLDANLVDELCLTVSPILGGDPLGLLATRPHQVRPLRLALSHAIGATVFLRYLVSA
jgi:riboflavin biosynthesis pyrimidine reductase